MTPMMKSLLLNTSPRPKPRRRKERSPISQSRSTWPVPSRCKKVDSNLSPRTRLPKDHKLPAEETMKEVAEVEEVEIEVEEEKEEEEVEEEEKEDPEQSELMPMEMLSVLQTRHTKENLSLESQERMLIQWTDNLELEEESDQRTREMDTVKETGEISQRPPTRRRVLLKEREKKKKKRLPKRRKKFQRSLSRLKSLVCPLMISLKEKRELQRLQEETLKESRELRSPRTSVRRSINLLFNKINTLRVMLLPNLTQHLPSSWDSGQHPSMKTETVKSEEREEVEEEKEEKEVAEVEEVEIEVEEEKEVPEVLEVETTTKEVEESKTPDNLLGRLRKISHPYER
jgi:hypothetical protein